MNSGRYRVGLVGCGQVSADHVAAWEQRTDVQVVATCDPDLGRAQARAARFDGARIYTEPAAMFAAERLDLVDIMTPRETHASVVRLAHRHGVHALCEKPLCPTFDEAQALVAEVGDGIRLMVNENWRYRTYYTLLGQWVREGRLGTIVHYRIALKRASLIPNPDGTIRPSMEAKFRQIHRFVELLSPLLTEARLLAGEHPLRVTDMGAGKGYLTFALHEHLRSVALRPVSTRGVEVRTDLVEHTNAVVRRMRWEGLEFVPGSIAGTPLDRTDVVIALHACDTATDDALARGIDAGATLLVVAPCCHKEIRPQIVPPAVLAGALHHGILLEREAEFLTDALRAALLECAGYEPRVFEFISPEHTSKNLMIVAIKREATVDTKARTRVQELARFYGVKEQRLAKRLGISLI